MKQLTILFFVLVILGFLVWFLPTLAPQKTLPTVSEPTPTIPAPPTEKTYTHTNPSFHFSYPPEFTLNQGYVYEAGGPNDTYPGVSVTIPSSFSVGTNLSSDTRFSVEWKKATGAQCKAIDFLSDAASEKTITEGGVTYKIASSGDAGAGNFYEQTVYVFPEPQEGKCVALRYFIHSTNIGAYDPGTVTEFDKAALTNAFDTIRRSFSF